MKQASFFKIKDIPADPSPKASSCLERERIKSRFNPLLREELHLANSLSYVGNKQVPILRLYRYKEAFAFRFVEDFIARFGLSERDYIFDPFCGMGTTLFTAMQKGIPSIGIDKLPIAVFVSQTLPLFFSVKQGKLKATFEQLQNMVHNAPPADIALDVGIMKVAFPPETLLELRRWKTLIDEVEYPLHDIFLLLFFSILEPCSYTSKDGQFLRLIRNKKIAEPTKSLQQMIYKAERDIELLHRIWRNNKTRLPAVYLRDTRDLTDVPFEKPPTAIITSPPYANRYDYTRSYSLELCFHFIKNFEELKALRFGILRSHIESKVTADEQPPHPVVKEVLEAIRRKGKEINNPRIPDMLTAYFVDMHKVIQEWASILAPGAKVAMVVDNVRFEGELLPVDIVLSEMAEEAGFQVEEIIVGRYKGNSSQQMKKYGRVPVRESIVIWRKGR